MILQHCAGPVGIQKTAQVIDLDPDLLPFIGIGDFHAPIQVLKYGGGVGHIEILPHCPLFSGKGLVGDDLKTVGVEGQRIPRDTAGGLVGFAEAAVDHDQPASAFDGALPFFCLNRDMAVDDVTASMLQAELFQNILTDNGIVVQRVVRILGFCP